MGARRNYWRPAGFSAPTASSHDVVRFFPGGPRTWTPGDAVHLVFSCSGIFSNHVRIFSRALWRGCTGVADADRASSVHGPHAIRHGHSYDHLATADEPGIGLDLAATQPVPGIRSARAHLCVGYAVRFSRAEYAARTKFLNPSRINSPQ